MGVRECRGVEGYPGDIPLYPKIPFDTPETQTSLENRFMVIIFLLLIRK